MNNQLTNRARAWLLYDSGTDFLNEQELSGTRDVFSARLDHFRGDLKRNDHVKKISALMTAVVGELGNNAFDHNAGHWRDVPGVYFAYNLVERHIVVADRGQGILATLRHIRPELKTDEEALRVALTERISGRSPEQRGNGLKFVARVISEQKWRLGLSSGSADVHLDGKGQECLRNERPILGVLAVLQF